MNVLVKRGIIVSAQYMERKFVVANSFSTLHNFSYLDVTAKRWILCSWSHQRLEFYKPCFRLKSYHLFFSEHCLECSVFPLCQSASFSHIFSIQFSLLGIFHVANAPLGLSLSMKNFTQ